ncbi:PREDICTED: zinc-finger homeodomain protein 2-like [Ipomoea nil]|uniref:zinc-finger homeodomain protein 2-like n=1 Tax=Ipomoea nil TaxID=35883 RepID=UPI000901AE6F|nr:PREDICTED: zinc-finger homeodomain protein 2-like [Ipomoea nil]
MEMEMEFDEEREEEMEMEDMEEAGNYQTPAGRGMEGAPAGGVGRKSGGGSAAANTTTNYRYKECLKNHAVGIGRHAVDGCGEFMPAGEEGSLDGLKCAACNCHRNFHRKEAESEGYARHQSPHHHLHPLHHHFSTFSSYRSPHPSGYLHVTPPTQHRPLALPSSSRDEEDMSNPSSSGGGGSKKRFRTKFTAEQKDKMLALAERLGWRIQKQDEAAVQQFCAEANVKSHVFKVWMHNNKHTLGKKP